MSALSEKELKQFITMLEKIIKKAEKVSKRPNRNINFPLLPPDFQAAEKIRQN
jgi:Asp-tRNA(Asn)/Glu-tRNA(Gln) amidotransferase C subunit